MRRSLLIKARLLAAIILSHPAEFFLIAAVCSGLIICFRMAPLNGTDEFTHFPRAYQISEGVWWEKQLPGHKYGGDLPVNINQMVNDYRDLSRKGTIQEFNKDKGQLSRKYIKQANVGEKSGTAVFGSAAVYPPWSYLPSIIGIKLANILGLPLLWYVYLGRLLTLLVWLGLAWSAIKILPEGKWFLVAVALLPTSITQAATIGLDGMINGLSWLLIACVFAVASKKLNLTYKTLILLALLSLAVCIVKQGYWLIALWPLVIPHKYFTNKRVAIIWKAVLVVAAGIAGLGVSLLSRRFISSVPLTPRWGIYINEPLQAQYVLHHPLIFLARALTLPFTKNFDTIYLGVVGILTNRLVYLSILMIGLLYLTLAITIATAKTLPTLTQYRYRLISAASIIIIGTYLLISIALYLTFTGVGSPIIEGIAGRYFLPLLPLLLVIPLTRKSKLLATYLSKLVPAAILGGLLSTILSLG